MEKTIAVFGASHYPAPDHPDWTKFSEFGAALAREGYTVLTGGYEGIMGSFSQGAFEAEGEVIGVTCKSLEEWHSNVVPNPHLTQEIAEPSLMHRIDTIIRRSDAYIIMPGGVGTLAELTCCWNMISVEEVPLRPVILFGPQWAALLQAFYDTLGEFVHNRGEEFLYQANNIKEIQAILKRELKDTPLD